MMSMSAAEPCMDVRPFDDQDGFLRSISDTPPTHYTVEIESFSILTKKNVDKYESGEFEAGGYKWKLVLYPNGNKNRNVKDHISLYLAIAEVSSLPPGWEVYATFRLFLLDQEEDEYYTLQLGKERRFRGKNLQQGFDEFIPLKDFNDASSGFLVDDNCVFGAEVYVCKERRAGKGERVSMMKDVMSNYYIWRIENFSTLDADCYDSAAFNAGGQKWKIKLYSKGKGNGMGTHLSLYLALADSTNLPPDSKIFADFKLQILDLRGSEHYYNRAAHWFSASSQECGWSRFITQTHFQSQKQCFQLRDTCMVLAEVTVHGVTNAV